MLADAIYTSLGALVSHASKALVYHPYYVPHSAFLDYLERKKSRNHMIYETRVT